MISPIQVRRHSLRHVAFSSQQQRPKESSIELEVKLHHEKTEHEDLWLVILRVKIAITDKKDELPENQIEVEFEGLFSIHPDYPEENPSAFVRMNGGAVLYGAARELIHQLSSRTTCGPLEIPTIDARVFLKDGFDGNEKKEETAESK